MGLRFIIGPAGSGKTQYIIDSVIEGLLRDGSASQGPEAGPFDILSKPPVLIIVPDQATFQMEKAILEDGRIRGFMNLHVLGFRRLCLKVLDEVGGVTRPFITPVGRSMAVQSILWEHRDDLKVYAPLVDYPGFRDEVIRAFSEFSAYDISPEDLKTLSMGQASHPPFLSQKLQDLELIYRKYREFLQDRLLDPDDYLILAAQRIPRSSLVQDATVWIDGFSGFTPREYEVIEAILRTASQVNLALCMDREEIQHPPNETSLFHPVREVYEKTLDICRSSGISVEDAIILGEDSPLPRFKHPELACLESAFRSKHRGRWRAFEPLCDETNPGGVCLVSAVNLQAEVEFVAREILRLVREEGLRFRDITVELRNLETYKHLIEMVFTRHGIPYFLDLKSSLAHHPLAELIRSAFDIVLTDFSFDPVFRYLKTDLVPLDRECVDELENYVLACGIRGKQWILDEPWAYTMEFISDDEASAGTRVDNRRVDGIRRQAMAAFSRFYQKLEDATRLTAEGISLALFDLLVDLGVQETLARWQQDCEQRGDLISAMEHAGVWDKVLEILEQAVEILGPLPCDIETYALIMNAGLEDMRLGAIPPSLDQVLVGSLDRTRQPECQVTFLLGASEGSFPMKHGEKGVFTDEEREILLKAGLNLEPSSRLKQLHEEYLVYIAFTRPRKALYISYPLGDNDGKAMFPSPVISWIKATMPYKQIRFVSTDPPGSYPEDLHYVAPATVWGVTARRLSLLRQGLQPGIVWEEVYRWMLEPSRVDKARKILGALGFTNKLEHLGQALSAKLYGQPLITSVSRLERFQRCPFSHFAADGLGLKQRQVFRLDPLKTGSFFHEAMREFVREVSAHEEEVSHMEQQQIVELMDQVIGRLVPRIQDRIFLSSSRYRYISNSLGALLRSSARVFLEHAKRGDFRPLAVEVPFGLPGGVSAYPVDVPGHGQVLLRGRIDRVDVARMGSRAYFRVVDYKSSKNKLDLLEVYYGLSLQLLVYLAVVLEKWNELATGAFALTAGPAERRGDLGRVTPYPAGAVYLPMHDPFIRSDGPLDGAKAWAERKKNLKMAGLLLEDIDVLRLMDSAASGYSDILPVQFTKAGGIGANSQTLAGSDLELLLGYVEHKLSQICADIIAGKIDIRPYRRNRETACTHCEFSPVCTFDVLVEGNEYNTLSNLSKAQIWEEIREIMRGGE
ncbi:MAG: helicase-exonuclease AddAB subunit AddB [Bacillota bacterium]|jgi:ATP-dependent helicase/nuclease subunit B|nr:helicase-exonuclease AddAB subunit AddB [Candidatus Fermentithermobacillaceae bacterium]HOA70762.1 helicase-exonuclease AddAB subunit AddB [Bacillota bacterium]HPZ85083.1 helicase-exonuclease AddAB subunit AddB [Bacillota bacterium]HQD85747.1 helicase-exonuclease AddAB subunit AddB [Bacillota bacterium]